jgi:amino acid adenylation domain-containing protein
MGNRLAYWRELLAGASSILTLPLDRERHAGQVRQFARMDAELPLFGAANADPDGQRLAVEAPAAWTAAFFLLLHRYSGEDRVNILYLDTSGASDSRHGEVDPVIVQSAMSGGESASEFVRNTDASVRTARSHAPMPFAELVDELLPGGQGGHHPFSQVGLAIDTEPCTGISGCELDLSVSLHATAGGLQTTWRYNAELFERETMAQMAAHLGQLLEGLQADAPRRVFDIPLLTGLEEQIILRDPNATAVEFPADSCLHDLFGHQRQLNPGAIAILTDQESVSYAELDGRSNRLAQFLRDAGVGPEVRVGICVERSVEMVIGILGILKAGGAYVPLDPTYPEERLAFMLADSRVSVLVSQRPLLEKMPAHGAREVLLDADAERIAGQPGEPPQTGVCPDNLAYVIYTSGSTGRPKGIALRHQGVVNNLCDLNRSFGIGQDARILAISALGFDMCVYEVLGTLAAGGSIVIPEAATARDPAYLARLVQRQEVTVWNSAPPLLEMLVDEASRTDLRFPSLRVAILGGDWVKVSLPDRLRALAPSIQVVVLGGATEASIHSIVYPVGETDPEWRSIPYGVPMANQKAFIVDANLQAVPVGVAGELCLGGIGLARGYFDQPGLTAERFLPNPFSGEPGDRMYLTGDLARWMRDGNIELLGRIDNQIKIRGHRIELGEIAVALREHPSVQDTVLVGLPGPDGDKRLVAYVVPEPEGEEHRTAGDGVGELVSSWREIYDETYAQNSEYDPRRNFVGWNSSYTGKRFPEPELVEMHDRTIAAIEALRPDRVLEIGCGSGLILFRVAPGCSRYDASDISPVVIQRLQSLVDDGADPLPQVSLSHRAADDFSEVRPGAYDTVILNSVTQHFPDVRYLGRVVESALRALKPGGSLFIGDVRNLEHLELFCSSIELHQAPEDLSVEALRQRIEKRMRQEKELWVHPQLFVRLGRQLPDVARVSIRLKRGRHSNEITRFHYDVVMKVASDSPAAVRDVDWRDWQREGWTPAKTGECLAAEKPAVLALAGVPNGRIQGELGQLARVGAAGPESRLTGILGPADANGVEPEDLWMVAENASYRFEICYSQRGHDCFDALFTRRDPGGHEAGFVRFPLEEAVPGASSRLGNSPMASGTAARLTPRLRDFLGQRLPTYMVPSTFVYLDALPLSPNGKIDRKALPVPDFTRPDLDLDYVPAGNALEELLTGIFAQVLELEKVGIRDNFFDLGGHSLNAVQIIARVRDLLELEVSLQSLFESRTVSDWADRIVAEGGDRGIDVLAIAGALMQIDKLSDEEVQALLDAGPEPGAQP